MGKNCALLEPKFKTLKLHKKEIRLTDISNPIITHDFKKMFQEFVFQWNKPLLCGMLCPQHFSYVLFFFVMEL